MSKVLKVTTEWCADSDEEVEEILKAAANDGGDLAKKTIELKAKKKNGEIISERYKVTTQVVYDDMWSDVLTGEKE